MSRRSIMDNFYSDTKVILATLGILDDASHIYNVEQSWYNDEQMKQNLVAVKGIWKPSPLLTSGK